MEAVIGAVQLLYLAKSQSVIFILHYNTLQLLKYDFVMVWCNKVLIIDLQKVQPFFVLKYDNEIFSITYHIGVCL